GGGAATVVAILADAPMIPRDARDKLSEGVAHFNATEFWEAHESWEHLWLEAEGDLVEFYQGLIQLAAAYHHAKRGTLRGAVRLFDASLKRLEPFPADFLEVDRRAAIEVAQEHRQWAGDNIESKKMLPADR